MSLTFVAFLAEKKKRVDESMSAKITARIAVKKRVDDGSSTKMTLRSAKKHIKFDDSNNKIEIYFMDKDYRKKFYFDSSQINENLKNRREIIAKFRIDGW